MTNKELYKYYKDKKICPWCKKNKAVKGKVKCLICLMDDREYRTQKRENLKLLNSR